MKHRGSLRITEGDAAVTTHFLDPIADAHARRTDEIIAAYDAGTLTKDEAGRLLYEHVFGDGMIDRQIRDRRNQ